MTDKAFFNLTVVLCAAAYIANGGWNGRRFGRLRNWNVADILLFLAWAMFMCGVAAMMIETR